MKVDRLMPMLETLAIDEVIEVAQLDLQKGLGQEVGAASCGCGA
jgi:hypothetical protein